ncbi:MAG TPA: amino acid adenylation domain-containing protein [Roseiflexaceae bacterium]|nr:amino acid adenylation domain-containing protein [Roseiflexaceae bacterium]
MSDPSSVLDHLSPSKRKLFELMLEQKRRAEGVAPPSAGATLVADPDGRFLPFPLTDMQQAYWVGRNAAFSMGNVATHMYEEFESDELDLDRLNATWRRLIDRHDMLRAIVLPDGQQQVLAEVPPYTIDVTDLRDMESFLRDAYLDATRQRMSHQMFQADQWPLFEIHASRLGETHYRIHISIDGLLLDGWSYQLLFQEWFQTYQDPAQEREPLPITFRDYVMAEQALRDTPEHALSLAYWRERLAGLPPAPALPLVQHPSMLLQPRFVRRHDRIEPQEWQQLKTAAARFSLTPNSVLLAVYAEVLARWSKSQQFTINVPRFNRLPLHPLINDVLGEFASFTLLAVDARELRPFEERARRLQEQLWRDLEHHHISGVWVLRELARLHGRDGDTTMPIVFTSLPHEVDAQRSALPFALSDKTTYGITQTSQVWLDCQGVEESGALVFNWDAVEDLFPEGMLDGMFAAFCSALRSLASDSGAWHQPQLIQLPAEQVATQAAANNTAAPLPDTLVQELFLQRAALQPDQPAVVSADRTLSYDALARHSNRLARRLRHLGARPNTLVAVVMEKGWEQIVAAMGTLVSGAAYLPIDAAQPPARLRALLEHSRASIALTQSWLDEEISWPPSVQRICLDTDPCADESDQPLQPSQQPDDLAYVIYTSGSTGQPKGVMITQRGLTNALLATNQTFAITPADRALALTALHHDMSVYDIFGVLAAGGTVVIPEARQARDPGHWADLLAREQITVWNSVPAMMEMLLTYVGGRAGVIPASLRLVFLGGDWIAVSLPERLQALGVGAQVVSVGGPTETTLWNIWYPVEAVEPTWASIPYGRPIANTRYHVLNEQQADCPTWVPGMLHCAGVGVMRGYWDDPERTAAAITTHLQTGERLYRTGDLGRYLPDGTIEFLGREDFQVKIQGMRIELGEIEAALAQHPQIQQAVVTVAGETAESRRLVAHLVPVQEESGAAAPVGDVLVDADALQHEGVLADAPARLAFKLQQHGLRSVPDAQTVALPQPEPPDELRAAHAAHRSYRAFRQTPLPLESLAALLGSLRQIRLDGLPLPKYRYPSAGGLYPLQTYVHVKPGRVDGLRGGCYYYRPQSHELALLAPDVAIDPEQHVATNRALADQAAFSILLIADMRAIEPMYGPLARDFCLLEAGYMGQLLMSAAPEQQLGLCPIGSLRLGPLGQQLGLDEAHVLIHGLLGGAIEAWQSQPEGLAREFAATTAEAAPRQATLIADIRAFLHERLPDHMVPTMLRLRDSLPLTPNGKVDRAALARDRAETFVPEVAFVAPQTDLEQVIAEAVKEILQIEKVGIYDNFFELGGNSLHLVQLHSRLQEALGRELVVLDLFQHPTVAALVEALSQTPGAAPTFQEESQERADLRNAARKRSRGFRYGGRSDKKEGTS